MKYIVWFFVGILLIPCISNAQNTISGMVLDNAKNPIEGVNIYLPDFHKGTISNKEGRFEVQVAKGNPCSVQFSMIGYETRIMSSLENMKEVVLNKSIIEMEEVVISGGFANTADRSAVKIESISAEKLHFRSTPSLTLALADEPAVEMVKAGNAITKPVIRGLSGNRVVVLYQGARTSNQEWGEEHGVFIPEEGIETVEIVKGPSSLLFGSDAMGGVLNFIPLKPLMKEGRKNKFSTAYYSSSNGIQSSFISQKKRKDWFHTYGLGYQNHADYHLPNGNFAQNSGYTQHYAFGNWGITKKWGMLQGVYSSSYTNTGLVQGVVETTRRAIQNPWQQIGDHFVTTEGIFWANDWVIKPFVSYQLNHRKEFEDDTKNAALDMGLRSFRFDMKSIKSSKNFEMILGSQGMYQTNTNYGEEILIEDANTKDISLYSLANKKSGNFQTQAGARVDYRKINLPGQGNMLNFLDYTYSLGSTYNLSEKYVFRTNIAKGFRSPNLYELTADGEHHGANRYERGDKNLKSENNLESDISFHIHNEHYAFDLALYHNFIKDYIYLTPTLSDTTLGEEILNIYEHKQDDAKLYGGEAGIDFHPHFLHDLHLSSTISVVFADNLELNKPLAMTPAHKWNNEVEYEFLHVVYADKLKFACNYNYHFKQDRIADEEEKTDAYALINATIGWYKGNHQIAIHGQNLLNTAYIPHLSLLKEIETGVYEQGRNFAVKYSYSF